MDKNHCTKELLSRDPLLIKSVAGFTVENAPSELLLAFLRYTKYKEDNVPANWASWRATGDALSELYGSDLPLVGSMHLMLKAFGEAAEDARFQIPGGSNAQINVVTSPLTGYQGLFGILDRRDLNAVFSVDQFYSSIAAEILTSLRLTRVDWCRRLLWPSGYP
jgi:hypothetical protein